MLLVLSSIFHSLVLVFAVIFPFTDKIVFPFIYSYVLCIYPVFSIHCHSSLQPFIPFIDISVVPFSTPNFTCIFPVLYLHSSLSLFLARAAVSGLSFNVLFILNSLFAVKNRFPSFTSNLTYIFTEVSFHCHSFLQPFISLTDLPVLPFIYFQFLLYLSSIFLSPSVVSAAFSFIYWYTGIFFFVTLILSIHSQ